MSISFGGLVSGLPVDDIISQLIALERRPVELMQARIQDLRLNDSQFQGVGERVATLEASLKKLTAESILDEDLFKAKSATSADDTIATATAGETASAQTIQLSVTTLATATQAISLTNVGQSATGLSDMADMAQGILSDGDFTVFVNGTASTVTVDVTQDLNSVLTQLSAIAGIDTATVTGAGEIQLGFTGGTTVQLGANGDTTNFLDLTFLSTGTQTGTSITSSVPLSTIDLSAVASSADANLVTAVTDGTFTIGTATIDTTGKSMNDIIAEINATSDTGVSAAFNIADNRLELTAKDSGSPLITLADGTGNFLTAMGLIDGGGDTTTSQTAGQNAEFVMNGTTLYSASNTVSQGITGITGVTLELTGETTGAATELTIARDTEDLKTTLTEFVSSINQVISFIDEQTDAESTTAQLTGETGLLRFRNSLRQTTSDFVAGLTQFSSLSMVGISTGAINGTATGANSTFVFDETAFEAALAENSSQVKDLMTGTNGILTQLQAIVENATHDDPDATLDGIFASHKGIVQDRIEGVNDQISRAEDRLERRETFLRAQFRVMEQLISQSQNQGSALAGLSQQLSANNR